MAVLSDAKPHPADRSDWPIVIVVGCTVAAGAAYAVFLWSCDRRRRPPKNKDPSSKSPPPAASTSNESLFSLLPSHLQLQIHKEERRRAKLPWLTRKTPLYDNIHMLDPTGHLLCNVSHKKANWYLRKGLATWTDEEQHTSIQLLFTPQGGHNHSNNITSAKQYDDKNSNNKSNGTPTVDPSKKRLYNTSVKQNICVACGASDNLIRHYVVPLSYRKLFPIQFKSHQPHDIVLLCADCHMTSDQYYQERMQELDEQHRPVDEHVRHTAMSHFIDPHLTKVQSYALALLRYRDKMPVERIQEYEQYLAQHHLLQQEQQQQQQLQEQQGDYQGIKMDLSTDQLQELSRIDVRVVNENYIHGANLVVDAMTNDDEQITNFIIDWRRFFVEQLQPHYLPIGWSIDSPVISDMRVKQRITETSHGVNGATATLENL